jgi:Ppx/GppA phosphatase family
MSTRKAALIVLASTIAVAVLVRGVFSQSVPQEGSICAIDMGSNTFRRIVGSFHSGKYVQRPIEKKTLGVGDDVAQHGRISEAKLADIGTVLSAFKSSCAKDGATRVVAVGTAAFRDASNGSRVPGIAAKAGVAMEIASQRRESELAYLVGSLGRDDYAVIDHGSRSIELVSKTAGTLRYAVSSLGYRIAYEKFFAAQNDPIAAIDGYRDQLRREVSKAPFMKGKKKLIGVEFADMIDVLFEPGGVEQRVLTLQQLRDRLGRITAAGPSGFKTLKQTTDIDRALPRLVAAEFLTGAFGYSSIELTDRELGSGLIIEAGVR